MKQRPRFFAVARFYKSRWVRVALLESGSTRGDQIRAQQAAKMSGELLAVTVPLVRVDHGPALSQLKPLYFWRDGELRHLRLVTKKSMPKELFA